MCLVVLFSDFGINTYPKILCPEDLFQADHELQHLQKTVFSSFGKKEKNHLLCRSSLQTTFKHQEEDFSATTVRNRSQCRSVCKKTSCVRFPSTDDSEGTAYAGQENMFLDAATMGFCAVHRRVQIYNGK
ncbi:uncharacterized protein TNCV_3606801 [Trichonephila clavipes]|nr:uncharacterized protein TNCV_3606801 [Trichonephila clavipes]